MQKNFPPKVKDVALKTQHIIQLLIFFFFSQKGIPHVPYQATQQKFEKTTYF